MPCQHKALHTQLNVTLSQKPCTLENDSSKGKVLTEHRPSWNVKDLLPSYTTWHLQAKTSNDVFCPKSYLGVNYRNFLHLCLLYLMQQCADTIEEWLEWGGFVVLNPWVNSSRANAHVCQNMCVLCVCVCMQKREGEKERGYKRHTNMREDKSFSCFSNILIFHECLFDVVLNIHVFMLSRKREMMQKNVPHSGKLRYALWGTNTLHVDTIKLVHTTVTYTLTFSLTRHLQWNTHNFLSMTALLLTIRPKVRAD